MSQKGRSRRLVIFLDANIDAFIALRLFDMRAYAHWISFGSARPRPTQISRKKNATRLTKRQILRIKKFFDAPLGQNILEANGTPPYKMDDCALLSYMVALINKYYLNKDPYLFYTKDRKFLKQGKMQNHPHLRLFYEGKIIYIPLVTPPQGEKGFVVTARSIRHDLEKRLEIPCRCKRIFS